MIAAKASASLAVAIAAAALMSWQSQSSFSESVPVFWCLSALILAAGFMFWRQKYELSKLQVLALAALLHGIGLFGAPMFEDDYYRYLWDGYRSAEFGDAYAHPPEFYFDDARIPVAMQSALSGVNSPEVASIYGPVPQALFAAGYALAPGNEIALRALTALLHIGFIALLIWVGARPRHIALYLLNPLVFKEIALTGHFDFLVPFGLIAAWHLLTPQSLTHRQRIRNGLAAGAWIAIAIASKFITLLALPLLIWRGRGALLLGCGLMLTLLYWPYLGSSNEVSGLRAFANDWRFNAGVFALVDALAPSIAKLLIGCAMAIAVLISSWRARREFSETPKLLSGLFAGLILLGPVINPWYWLWVLPWMLLARPPGVNASQKRASDAGLWSFWISGLLLLSYGHGLFLSLDSIVEAQAYALPVWLAIIEHCTIGLVLALAYFSVQAKGKAELVNPARL